MTVQVHGKQSRTRSINEAVCISPVRGVVRGILSELCVSRQCCAGSFMQPAVLCRQLQAAGTEYLVIAPGESITSPLFQSQSYMELGLNPSPLEQHQTAACAEWLRMCNSDERPQ